MRGIPGKQGAPFRFLFYLTEDGMAEDIKFFLAWQVFLLPFFQAVIKSPCFL